MVQGIDADGLVKPKAFVGLSAGFLPSDVLVADLQAYARAHMAPHKYPRWIHFRDELPRTATGKLQRYRLVEEPGR